MMKPKAKVPDLSTEAALGFFSSSSLIIGLDEVGRGCLAGPVVAGAASLDPLLVRDFQFCRNGSRPDFSDEPFHHSVLSQVKDSKLIAESMRPGLAEKLAQFGVQYAVARASVAEIRELNILHAAHLAMIRALFELEERLNRRADYVIVDGNLIPRELKSRGNQVLAVVKGDLKSITIACASLFAKVHRDALMEQLDITYPGFGFKKHKGYPTPFHKAQILKQGATPEHRIGFKGVAV